MQELLEFQLDILKQEIDTINSSIRQMDTMSEKVKNWGIVTWTAAAGAAISHPEFKKLILLTCCVPVVFWFVDVFYRRIQRRFIWRSTMISSFLNDGRLATSFEERKIVDFQLFDPNARTNRDVEYDRFVSVWTIIRFKNVSMLYVGLICMSLIAILIG